MLAAGERGAPWLFNKSGASHIFAFANTCIGLESWRAGAGRKQVMGAS